MGRIDDMVIAEDYDGDVLTSPEAASTAAGIDRRYYDFSKYVSKTRMLTFYHQIEEVIQLEPDKVLEVGVGSRVVSGTLRELGVDVRTFDINPSLTPDIVGSVTHLSEMLEPKSMDVILCARVLHHLSYAEFDVALAELSACARRAVILTLPRDEARLYFGFRRTGSSYIFRSLELPRFAKKLALRVLGAGESRYAKLWKIDSHPETLEKLVHESIQKRFRIEKTYAIPEDRSHVLFVLVPLE